MALRGWRGYGMGCEWAGQRRAPVGADGAQ